VDIVVDGYKHHAFNNNILLFMGGFDYDFTNMTLKCKRCGSTDVTIRPGMMTDRAICNNCGNEDYI